MQNAANNFADSTMARFVNVATLLVLFALTALTWAQVAQDGADSPPEWTTCDILGPKLSCRDCSTRLICKKPNAGLLLPCDNPFKPHCNMGICSAVPSAGCAA